MAMRRGRSGLAYFVSALIALGIIVSSPAQAQTVAPNIDDKGWTILTPSADTRTIYVSNSQGSDSNDGRSESAPVRNIARGLALIRHGYPDWLLLKKGDTWTDEAFGVISGVANGKARSGRSANEPMLFGAYGTGARPLIKTNPLNHAAGIFAFGGGGGGGGNYLAVVGLEFYAYTRDPDSLSFNAETITNTHSGIILLNPIDWLLIEDCKFGFYRSNLSIQGASSQANVMLRRSIITDAYSVNSHSQGIYVDGGMQGMLIEENLFDHNGWHADIEGTRTKFNHNVYYQGEQGPVIYRGNISARASATGIQGRSGGIGTDNLFVANPLTGYFSGNGATAGQSNDWDSNVVLHGIGASGIADGWGLHINNKAHGSKMRSNIVAHYAGGGTAGFGYRVGGEVASDNVELTDNILYKWQTNNPLYITGGSAGIVSSGNQFDATGENAHGFIDPDRTIMAYDALNKGNGSIENFLAKARQQSKDNWWPEYTATAVNNYIRVGFRKAPEHTEPIPPPLNDIPAPTSPNDDTPATPSEAGSVENPTTPSSNDGASTSPSTEMNATITSPKNGALIGNNGSVEITVVASASDGVSAISILAGGNVLKTCTKSTVCKTSWRGNSIKEGTHTITAIAVSNGGKYGNDSISISKDVSKKRAALSSRVSFLGRGRTVDEPNSVPAESPQANTHLKSRSRLNFHRSGL